MGRSGEKRARAQGERWRRLDNTGKLFAAVTGKELSNVFRLSAVLTEEIEPALLQEALERTLAEYENFRVKLRKGIFWYYFETNNREPLAEREESSPCRFIDPHGGRRFPFRVSYYGKRINFEVFHGMTDGLGALEFMKALTETYLELARERRAGAAGVFSAKRRREAGRECAGRGKRAADGYLQHYRELPHRRYETERAVRPRGKLLPLGLQSVIHGYLDLETLKEVCHRSEVSVTRYLAAALIWSLIQVYTDGCRLSRPVSLNLPVNLRSFFASETGANFFSVVNIGWPAGPAPENFEQVLALTSKQMEERISRERLEETIAYNVSNEKKWYLRIAPLFVKQAALHYFFGKSMRAYTMTFSNLGKVSLPPDCGGQVETFQLLVGAAPRQRLKCGAIAFDGRLCLSFTSVLADTRLQDFFFHFLGERGVRFTRESNGAAAPELDRGNYPALEDPGRLRRAVRFFYPGLLGAALLSGFINYVTYSLAPIRWSLLTMAGAAYAAMTLRYSVFRLASPAGILFRQTVGMQLFLILADVMGGFRGWSLQYAVPCVTIFDVAALLFLQAVDRSNWQSSFMYQMGAAILGLLPVGLWAAGWIRRPFMTFLAAAISAVSLAGIFLLGRRSVGRELKRRFHV